MLLRCITSFLFAAVAVICSAEPVSAAATLGAPPLAASYWSGFIDHWTGVFQKQNGIVMAALVIGAVCLFIITRGKWRK